MMKDQRFGGPVLIIDVGTTFNRPENRPERFLAGLRPQEQSWITHARIDARSITALGHEPTECFRLQVPASSSNAFRRGEPPLHARPVWIPPHVPEANILGGNGVPNSGGVAAALAMEHLVAFLRNRVSAALTPRGGHAPGAYPLLAVIRLFGGSTIGCGACFLVLAALDHVLKEYNLLAGVWRVMMMTLPDLGEGFSMDRMESRRAGAYVAALGLDAFTARLRREGSVPFETGGLHLVIENPLVDHVVLFGGSGEAATLREDQLSAVVAHATALYMSRGGGVGEALQDHSVRLKHGLEAGAESNHSTFFARMGIYEICLDKDLARQRLAQRFALTAVRQFLQPGRREGGAVRSVVHYLLGEDPWEWLSARLEEHWPLPAAELPARLTGLPDQSGLERVKAAARESALGQGTGLARSARFSLQQGLVAETDQAILNRLLDGYLENLPHEFTRTRSDLEDLAQQARREADGLEQQAGESLRAAERNLLTGAADDRLRTGRMGAFHQALEQRIQSQWQADRLRHAAGLLEEVARRFDRSMDFRLRECLQRMQEAVAEPGGYYFRQVVADVDWNALRHPIPTRCNLWSLDAETDIYQRYQPLEERSPSGEWVARRDGLGQVLRACGTPMTQAVMQGDGTAILRLLEGFGVRLFGDVLEPLTLSGFAEVYLGGLEKALDEPLRNAWEFARGWVRVRDDVRQPETQYLIEVPSDDPQRNSLAASAARMAPDGVAPRVVLGRRQAAPAMVVAQVTDGYGLSDFALMASGGLYQRAVIARQSAFRRGTGEPVACDRRLSAMIAEEFHEWRALFTEVSGGVYRSPATSLPERTGSAD